MKSSSNLLSDKHRESWKDLPQGTQAESAANIMEAVEKSANQVAQVIDTPLQAPVVKIEVHVSKCACAIALCIDIHFRIAL